MRILAGQFKGRTLLPPPGPSTTRPITGRAKKSLFDVLGDLAAGRTVLDLYCGTGTLGLEALSRGAARCAFAERDRAVLARLQRNIEAVGLAECCTIWRGDVMRRLGRWLGELDEPVAVAFVDPPYAQTGRWSWPRVTDRLFEPLAAHLAGDGLVVLRTASQVEAPDRLGALATRRTRRYGDMTVTLYERRDTT